jgi:Tol biopolymer transport system component
VPTYSPDGQYIVYVNNNDGDKLYRKNANDNSNGTVITSEKSLFPKYSPDGNYIIYTHIED